MICAYCFIVRKLQIDAVSVYHGTAHCLEHLELVSQDGQPRQDWPKQGYCRMLSPTGAICILDRFHVRPHEALDGHTWEKAGQPRQADPSGAVSSSTTTSEQPADPAAPPAYCQAINLELSLGCCQDSGHDGPHESFGGVQW